MDVFTKKKRSEIMSKIRSKNTAAELVIFRELRKRGICHSAVNMELNPEQENNELLELIAFPYYQRLQKSLCYFLRMSRLPLLKWNGRFLFYLQKRMVIDLSIAQRLEKQEEERVAQEADEKKRKFINLRIMAHKNTARSIQMIADGIIWRNIDYNRQLMRLISDKPNGPGPIEKEVDTILRTIPPKDHVVIVNDLTRFCRTGDFTTIKKNGEVTIVEAKKRKAGIGYYDVFGLIKRRKKQEGSKYTRQEINQFILQGAILNKRMLVPLPESVEIKGMLGYPIVPVPIEIPHHIKRVKKLINESRKKFYAGELVEPGVYIEVLSWDKFFVTSRRNKNKFNILHTNAQNCENKKRPQWVKDGPIETLMFSTHFLFTKKIGIARNLTPFSVLPFKALDCVRLMTGSLEVVSYLHLPHLKKKLEETGWTVIERDWKRVFKHEGEYRKEGEVGDIPFPANPKSTIRVRKVDNGMTYQRTIDYTEIVQFLSAYYHSDFLIRSLSYGFDNNLLGTIFPYYTGEREILN